MTGFIHAMERFETAVRTMAQLQLPTEQTDDEYEAARADLIQVFSDMNQSNDQMHNANNAAVVEIRRLANVAETLARELITARQLLAPWVWDGSGSEPEWPLEMNKIREFLGVR